MGTPVKWYNLYAGAVPERVPLLRLGAAGSRVTPCAGKQTERRGRVQDWAKPFYKSSAWLKTREAYAASVGWLCEDCLAKGLIVPGKVVHHRTPLTPQNISDPTVTLDWRNLKLVCQDCHAWEHRQHKGERYVIAADGRVVIK